MTGTDQDVSTSFTTTDSAAYLLGRLVGDVETLLDTSRTESDRLDFRTRTTLDGVLTDLRRAHMRAEFSRFINDGLGPGLAMSGNPVMPYLALPGLLGAMPTEIDGQPWGLTLNLGPVPQHPLATAYVIVYGYHLDTPWDYDRLVASLPEGVTAANDFFRPTEDEIADGFSEWGTPEARLAGLHQYAAVLDKAAAGS